MCTFYIYNFKKLIKKRKPNIRKQTNPSLVLTNIPIHK